ncbi:MAG: Rrf2 family transcriptional regulator [Alphaproteobacteria bacterium]|nr:Rrf2 family transcriptional regulator [Alphaproteobacteria bacterium]
MLSMKAKYALRALTVLAKSKQDMTQSKVIAREAGVPIKFLENILQELKRNHFVESKRGVFGGYYLARPAKDISVAELMRVIDGPLAPVRCASLSAYQKCDDCKDERSCQIRKTMKKVRDAMADVLDKTSILDMTA